MRQAPRRLDISFRSKIALRRPVHNGSLIWYKTAALIRSPTARRCERLEYIRRIANVASPTVFEHA